MRRCSAAGALPQARVDLCAQALAFLSRGIVKRALGRPAARERAQLKAVLGMRRAGRGMNEDGGRHAVRRRRAASIGLGAILLLGIAIALLGGGGHGRRPVVPRPSAPTRPVAPPAPPRRCWA